MYVLAGHYDGVTYIDPKVIQISFIIGIIGEMNVCPVIVIPFMKYQIGNTIFIYNWTNYSETCLKQPLKSRQNKGLKDKW